MWVFCARITWWTFNECCNLDGYDSSAEFQHFESFYQIFGDNSLWVFRTGFSWWSYNGVWVRASLFRFYRTLLSILAYLNKAVIRTVTNRPPNSSSCSPPTKPLKTTGGFFKGLWVRSSHFRLTRTFLSNLVDLNKDVVRMVTARPLNSSSWSPFTKPLETISCWFFNEWDQVTLGSPGLFLVLWMILIVYCSDRHDSFTNSISCSPLTKPLEITLCGFFKGVWVRPSHFRFTRTFLSILADLNKDIVRMVTARPPNSSSLTLLTKPLETIPCWFFNGVWVRSSHFRFTRTFLSILADLNKDVARIVTTRSPNSISCSLPTKPLETTRGFFNGIWVRSSHFRFIRTLSILANFRNVVVRSVTAQSLNLLVPFWVFQWSDSRSLQVLQDSSQYSCRS